MNWQPLKDYERTTQGELTLIAWRNKNDVAVSGYALMRFNTQHGWMVEGSDILLRFFIGPNVDQLWACRVEHPDASLDTEFKDNYAARVFATLMQNYDPSAWDRPVLLDAAKQYAALDLDSATREVLLGVLCAESAVKYASIFVERAVELAKKCR